MRVLHVVPSLARRTGGPAVSVVEAAQALRAAGIDVDVFSTDLGGPAGAADRGRRARDGDLVDGAREAGARLFPARPPYRFAFSPELGRALRAEAGSYDVVHVHSLFLYPQLEAGRAARRARVPYVVSPRGALDPWLRQRGRVRKAIVHGVWQRRLLEHAAALYVTSPEEGRLIADVAPAVPRAVVPNGIDWTRFQALPDGAEFRRRIIANGDDPLIVNIGRIARKKGLDILVRAFARLAATRPLLRLAIVGPDDESLVPTLQAIADESRVGNRIHFTGLLGGRDKLAALAAATVWALPSHTENFGLAVVEALAAGVPAVVTPAVNLASELESAGAAVVCPAEDEPLAATLDRLLGSASTRELLGARGREFARRYDWAEVVSVHVDAYRAVASR